jgi:hypothetical protein
MFIHRVRPDSLPSSIETCLDLLLIIPFDESIPVHFSDRLPNDTLQNPFLRPLKNPPHRPRFFPIPTAHFRL